MDFAARYWGVLNRLRDEAVAAYARQLPFRRPEIPTVLLVVVGVLWAAGVAWVGYVLFEAVTFGFVTDDAGVPLTSRGARLGNLGVMALMLMPGLFVVWITSLNAVRMRRQLVAVRAYAARSGPRAERRASFDALADRWSGRVDTGGIEPACRFLKEHYPECAPRMLTTHLEGEGEERLTLVGVLERCPVLIQIVDFAAPGATERPPSLVVLVACPMELPATPAGPDDGPFRRPPEAVVLEETAAHASLSKDGMIVGWTPAGAWAIHGGPAGALLSMERLEGIARTLLDFCRSVPSPKHVPDAPIPPPDEGASSCEQTLEAFLVALRDRDALAALARAHPVLVSSPREPTPASLWKALDDAGARARTWRVTDARTLTMTPNVASWENVPTFSDASIKEAGSVDVRLLVDTGGEAEGPASVHLERGNAGRWSVCGYAVGGKQVLGVEFTESSS